MVGNLQNIFMEHDLYLISYKRKIDHFDPYNVFLAIATNEPVRLKTGFVVQGSHIRMISEGSCDTEDCINGWWKFIFGCQHRNKLHFKIYLNRKVIFK